MKIRTVTGTARRERALLGITGLAQELEIAECEIEAEYVATTALIGELMVKEDELEKELSRTQRIRGRVAELLA